MKPQVPVDGRPAKAADWLVAVGPRAPNASEHVRCIGRSGTRLGALWLSTELDGTLSVAERGSVVVLLTGDLEDRPHTPPLDPRERSGNEAELLLDLYARRGERGLDVLRGSFAYVIWDTDAEALFAARDPFGYHTLFYAECQDMILLSTSERRLLRQHEVSKEVNRLAAAAWVLGRPYDACETLFRDITRVPPGHRVRFGDGGAKLARYWRPYIHPEPNEIAWSEAVESFDRLLSSSVDRSLELGRAGIFLSGGVDSATIAAVAATRSRRHNFEPPIALSVVFRQPESDESDAQQAIARAIGMTQILLPLEDAFGPQGPVREALEAVQDFPTPSMHPWEAVHHRLTEQAADLGCGVLLLGGGSEWFSPEPAAAANLLLAFDIAALGALCASERRYYGSTWLQIAVHEVWRNGVRLLLRDALRLALSSLHAESIFTSWRRRRITNSLPAWLAPDLALRQELIDKLATHSPTPTLGQHARTGLATLDEPYASIGADIYHAWHERFGLYLREPFQDIQLVHFLLTLPPRYLWQGRRAKALAVATLQRHLPEFNTDLLRTAFFEDAFEELIAKEGRQALEMLGLTPTLAKLGVVDPTAVEHSLRRGQTGAEMRYSPLWQTLALESWLQARL